MILEKPRLGRRLFPRIVLAQVFPQLPVVLGLLLCPGCDEGCQRQADRAVEDAKRKVEQGLHQAAKELAEQLAPAPVRPDPEEIKAAVAWAETFYQAHKGQKYTQADGGWPYWLGCMKFVANAYRREFQSYSYAIDGANDLHAGKNKATVPPMGSWVFFDCWVKDKETGVSQNMGHVALAVDKVGTVIHVSTGSTSKVLRENYMEVKGATYIGWAWPKPKAAKKQ